MSEVDYGRVCTPQSKLIQKCREYPCVPLGLAGMLLAVVQGARTFKYKGRTSTSLYVLQLRVFSQAIAVGAMALGALYAMLKGNEKKQEQQ